MNCLLLLGCWLRSHAHWDLEVRSSLCRGCWSWSFRIYWSKALLSCPIRFCPVNDRFPTRMLILNQLMGQGSIAPDLGKIGSRRHGSQDSRSHGHDVDLIVKNIIRIFFRNIGQQGCDHRACDRAVNNWQTHQLFVCKRAADDTMYWVSLMWLLKEPPTDGVFERYWDVAVVLRQ